jgi:hypothetical protein
MRSWFYAETVIRMEFVRKFAVKAFYFELEHNYQSWLSDREIQCL